MNDLKLLVSVEKSLHLSYNDTNKNAYIEFITFDTNMNTIYLSDNEKIYQIDENSEVI